MSNQCRADIPNQLACFAAICSQFYRNQLVCFRELRDRATTYHELLVGIFLLEQGSGLLGIGKCVQEAVPLIHYCLQLRLKGGLVLPQLAYLQTTTGDQQSLNGRSWKENGTASTLPRQLILYFLRRASLLDGDQRQEVVVVDSLRINSDLEIPITLMLSILTIIHS